MNNNTYKDNDAGKGDDIYYSWYNATETAPVVIGCKPDEKEIETTKGRSVCVAHPIKDISLTLEDLAPNPQGIFYFHHLKDEKDWPEGVYDFVYSSINKDREDEYKNLNRGVI